MMGPLSPQEIDAIPAEEFSPLNLGDLFTVSFRYYYYKISLTPRGLAPHIGCATTTIYSWMRGQTFPYRMLRPAVIHALRNICQFSDERKNRYETLS